MFKAYPYTDAGISARIVPTDGKHIHFDANTNSGAGKVAEACWIEMRGILYGLSAHFHLWSDGTWNLGKEGEPEWTRRYHHLYLSRFGAAKSNAASDSARKKADELTTAIIRQWTAANPDKLAQAQEEENARQREKISERIAELHKQIASAQAELDKLGYFTCTACGRPEGVCSADPCPAVIRDREATL